MRSGMSGNCFPMDFFIVTLYRYTRALTFENFLAGMSNDSRPHTRGTELSATFAEEVRALL
jgi:hypothetical protein